MSEDVSLLQRIVEAINSPDFSLPVFSDVAVQVQRLLADDGYSAKDLERLIRSDQSLVSEVLRVANSPFYGGLAKVATVRDAAVRLGGEQLANLVMLAAERNRYVAKDRELNTLMVKLWRHAMGTALSCQWLARKLGYAEITSEAFLAGLIHDFGKLAVLKVVDRLKQQEGTYFPLPLVMQVMDAMHAEHGFRLAQQWNLPERYCTVVRDHHAESFDQDNVALLIVRLADQACIKVGIGLHTEASLELPATTEAQLLNAGEVLMAELEIMLEDTLQAAG